MRFFNSMKQSFINLNESYKNKKYKKYISNFYSPIIDENRFAQNIDSALEFDLVNFNNKNQIDGNLAKRFVMLEKNLLSNYIDAVKNEKTSYDSYLDRESILNDQIPQKLSILLKRQSRRGVCVEVLASKILNFFDVKTVYNECVKDNLGHMYLASIDFIKPNEEFFTLDEVGVLENFGHRSNITKIEELFLKIIKTFSRNKFAIVFRGDKKEMLDDLLYGVLVRRVLLGDNDVRSGNFGFLYNQKTRRIRLAPNFDFGGAFLENIHFDDLKYFCNKYPHLYRKFVDNFNKFIEIQKDDKDPYYKKFIINNAVNLVDYFQILNFMDKSVEKVKTEIFEIENDKHAEKSSI